MSNSINTEVILGVKINPKKLTKTVKFKSCNHNNPESAKFCGECGKPIYTEKQESIFSEKEEDALYDDRKKGSVCITGTYENNDSYIAIRLSSLSAKCEKEVDISNLDEKTEKLEKFFEKYPELNVKKEDIKIYHLLTIY